MGIRGRAGTMSTSGARVSATSRMLAMNIIQVWEIQHRNGEGDLFRSYPSRKHAYQSPSRELMETTLNVTCTGLNPLGLADYRIVQIRVATIGEWVDCLCKVCGKQTGHYTSSDADRRYVTCHECSNEQWVKAGLKRESV